MTPLSPEMTVGEIATTLPGAVELFRRAGISYCCGGGATLAQAAPGAGLTPEALLAALTALVEAARREAPEATPELIAHIRHRYHDTHREELDWLIPLAEKVERVHGDHEDAPLGLTEALIALQGELDAHMRKEEDILFPMMRTGGAPIIAHPIAQMRHEHDEVASLMAAVDSGPPTGWPCRTAPAGHGRRSMSGWTSSPRIWSPMSIWRTRCCFPGSSPPPCPPEAGQTRRQTTATMAAQTPDAQDHRADGAHLVGAAAQDVDGEGGQHDQRGGEDGRRQQRAPAAPCPETGAGSDIGEAREES